MGAISWLNSHLLYLRFKDLIFICFIAVACISGSIHTALTFLTGLNLCLRFRIIMTLENRQTMSFLKVKMGPTSNRGILLTKGSIELACQNQKGQ